jgi:hypothetical protein
MYAMLHTHTRCVLGQDSLARTGGQVCHVAARLEQRPLFGGGCWVVVGVISILNVCSGPVSSSAGLWWHASVCGFSLLLASDLARASLVRKKKIHATHKHPPDRCSQFVLLLTQRVSLCLCASSVNRERCTHTSITDPLPSCTPKTHLKPTPDTAHARWQGTLLPPTMRLSLSVPHLAQHPQIRTCRSG